jgi:hypothetical protein
VSVRGRWWVLDCSGYKRHERDSKKNHRQVTCEEAGLAPKLLQVKN